MRGFDPWDPQNMCLLSAYAPCNFDLYNKLTFYRHLCPFQIESKYIIFKLNFHLE